MFPLGRRRPLALARLRYLGFLSHRGLVRASLASFGCLVLAFAVLPLEPPTLARAGLAVVCIGWVALFGLYLAVEGTVVVRPRDGWYVAEDARAGVARHGRSLEEAVGNLTTILDLYGRDAP